MPRFRLLIGFVLVLFLLLGVLSAPYALVPADSSGQVSAIITLLHYVTFHHVSLLFRSLFLLLPVFPWLVCYVTCGCPTVPGCSSFSSVFSSAYFSVWGVSIDMSPRSLILSSAMSGLRMNILHPCYKVLFCLSF